MSTEHPRFPGALSLHTSTHPFMQPVPVCPAPGQEVRDLVSAHGPTVLPWGLDTGSQSRAGSGPSMQRVETNYTYACKTDKRLILSSLHVFKEKLTFSPKSLALQWRDSRPCVEEV